MIYRYLFIFLLSATALMGQTGTKNNKLSIDSALVYFKDNYPQEKIVIQTDRTTYSFDDNIWIKLWCTVDGIPSYLSKVVYVDLVDDKGVVVQKKMYKLDSLSSTPADFQIPFNVKTGNYAINAYSLWMLNFPQLIPSIPIFIYGSDYTAKTTFTSQSTIKMLFFPEGGNLIVGVENKVAFKMLDSNGKPIDGKGTITTAEGNIITEFTAVHDGMGVFSITPQSNTSYLANIGTANNSATLQFKLPQSSAEGIAMQVINTNPNRVTVLVNRGELNKANYNKVKLIAQINNNIVFAQMLDIEQGQIAAAINKKQLPAGIMQITVFSENDIPLSERIVFVENYTIAKPDIANDAISFKPRTMNKVSFQIPNSNKTSLSVAVYDDSNLSDSTLYQANLAAGLFITSDLHGYINNPSYYLKNKSPQTLQHLDLLLMTQGWRRFEWKKILNNDFELLKYPVESTMSLRGTVTKSDRSTLVKDGFVSFIIKTSDSTTILAEAKLTDKGEFLLSDINFTNKAAVYFMGTDVNKKKYIVDIKMQPSYFDTLQNSSNISKINLDTIDLATSKNILAQYFKNKFSAIDTSKGSGYLGNVTVKSKKLSPVDSLNKVYADGPFLMGRGINPTEYKNYRTIWQIIQAATPGITVSGNPFDPDVAFNRYQGLNAISDNTSASSEETSGAVTESNGIAYFLNGVNVTKDIINTLSVDDVAYIKVLKQEASVLGATQGAIAIYTNSGAVARANPYDKTYSKLDKNGYALVKEFYSPDYLLNPELDKNTTDNRYLLYWNAKPRLAKDGKYHFTFFNNDSAKKYRILIQGLDNKGNVYWVDKVIK